MTKKNKYSNTFYLQAYWNDLISQVAQRAKMVSIFKNIPPPIEPEDRGKRIYPKRFKELTVTDFPARGKRVTYIIKRRRWKIEGKKGILVRDLKIRAEGTQLEKEFGDFLKTGNWIPSYFL